MFIIFGMDFGAKWSQTRIQIAPILEGLPPAGRGPGRQVFLQVPLLVEVQVWVLYTDNYNRGYTWLLNKKDYTLLRIHTVGMKHDRGRQLRNGTALITP